MISYSDSDLFSREVDPAFKRRAEIIFTQLKLQNKKRRVLDLGCGRGFYANNVAKIYPEMQIWGVDMSEKYLNQARQAGKKNVTWEIGDATNLKFANNFFDWIICSEVLEHISEDKKVLAEISRVLKPGGKVIITVPHKNYPSAWDPLNWTIERISGKHIPANIWWLAGVWADHVRLYREKEILKIIQMAGLQTKNIWRTTRWALPFSHFLLYGIGKNLVEKGFVSSANRFNYHERPGIIVKVIKNIFSEFDKLNNIFPPTAEKPYFNMVILAEKI